MMRRIIQIEAGLISISGLALWLAVGAAVRRNVYMVDREVLVSPAFGMSLFAALGIAAILILRGPTAVHRQGHLNELFVYVEGPLTLVVSAALIWIVNAWEIVGDMGPANPIGASGGLPIMLTAVVNRYVFYLLTLGFLFGVVLMLARARRNADAARKHGSRG